MTTDVKTPPDAGTPPDAPAPADPGTPPAAVGKPASPEPADPPKDGDDGHPAPTAAEKSAFARLRAKYPNMSDDEFQETVAENYWNSTREISSRERRISELEAKLAEVEKNVPAEPEPEPEPVSNPQLERIDARIQRLSDAGKALQQDAQRLLVDLPKLDREIAKVEAREEDIQEALGKLKGDDFDSSQRTSLETKLNQHGTRKLALETQKASLVDRLRGIQSQRERADYEMEGLLADKDWITRLGEQQREQQRIERQDAETFNTEFPKYVDRLITETADRLEAPKEEKIRNSLWMHVNRAIAMDFGLHAEQGFDQVDVPEMVERYAREYLEDRDLVGRTKFAKDSKDKLDVTDRAPNTPAPPPAPRAPVAVAHMAAGEQTSAMAAARKYLEGKLNRKS